MAALTSDVQRQVGLTTALENHTERTHPQLTATTIYEGSLVSQTSGGYARALTAGDVAFLGMAAQKSVNAGASGAVSVDIIEEGHVDLLVAGAVITTPVGTAVYATTDNDLTLTESTNIRVGSLSRFIGADGYGNHAATSCLVFIQSTARRVQFSDPTP